MARGRPQRPLSRTFEGLSLSWSSSSGFLMS
jgi:hypothetical protein